METGHTWLDTGKSSMINQLWWKIKLIDALLGTAWLMIMDTVTLNVGGHLYTTSLSTLQRYPDSMLGAMFRGDFPTTRDAQGNYFIDRDGPLFRYILNFLRTSKLTLPCDFKETELLRKEADFYQIEPLIQSLGDTKPLYPLDTFEQVVELSSTRKLSKYSNPVAVIITQLTVTTKVHALLEGISNNFTRWNKHMMDTRDFQVSFTFGPCDYHQEVSLRVHLVEYISKQGFTIRNTRVHHMSERANENTYKVVNSNIAIIIVEHVLQSHFMGVGLLFAHPPPLNYNSCKNLRPFFQSATPKLSPSEALRAIFVSWQRARRLSFQCSQKGLGKRKIQVYLEKTDQQDYSCFMNHC
ncbi:BTB/POZ domain-containing protein KCTD6 [Labeo rohita]|uniref:BTB/POZ domain-containing protein KCTD6 n=1 Tax=Labeo rohita TaxID=84645 RepID=A0ABQ8LLR3_LABRO|nr:BTB/POZ domain-containing protein KCTD6 [Labeo rohita]